ncbi:MAG: electron transfer flavoprotein-ubiquinone oxidoreductase, partial [Gemmatimonadetes bacterium]|nr:electron transfer flavoprotein-ubiquinone oxidoreductase [Gemmatimonadota bacterium]
MARFRPSDTQPKLPIDRLIIDEPPSGESLDVDVLFVGGGPSGLAGAIELARLVKQDNESADGLGEVSIGVLEKAAVLGEHCLSGAMVNPSAFRNLFPDLRDKDFPFRQPVTKEAVYVLTGGRSIRIPTPLPMRNDGNYVASICEVVRWLGKKAEELGVDVFAGYPAASLRVKGQRVVGVRTAPTGLDRDGSRTASYTPGTDIVARVTALAEGSR